ncbi:uncharacterized protein F4807DRAFT_110381 [Annulohypoxylon truncatum]|uniref:uncharacterized protein n=1 Tax=Annulohypoxylon truncatum TaxID=327061 RepID=UPI002007451F|nr:uncharacterized protein F4807DRAFT_110381 [Annulohypoxylon truncatum]KAI1209107.1 hypothetical protein F4807DRAFT_110381 [Annulohypoxylon truncatum]
MTFSEASRSPPRHSTHHRRRHHQPRDESKSYQVSNDGLCLKHPRKQHRSSLDIVNLDRPSQPHTRYDIVENWLAQTARQSPHSCPRNSKGHRREDAHNHHPSKPLNAIAPYNKHPRRVDQKWSPRHGFPAESLPQSASPFQDLGMRDPRKSRRRRIVPSDSSFISGFGNFSRPPDYGPGPIPQGRENIPPARSSREASLAPPDTPSIASHVDEQINFEKRPRRKTREDKYETKNKKRYHEKEGSGYEEHRKKKRKKAEKRKSTISSKNVVNNFTSDAVLNDRITVQPHLKPGLFENGRTSKKQPISDLAFSEMQFLKHQKRNPQPKPLSKSRLREKRREDREMEEVSSFFLPHGTDKNNRAPKPHDTGSRNDHHGMGYQADQFSSTRLQGKSSLSSSDHCLYSAPVHVSQPRGEAAETFSPNTRGCIDGGKDSGKSTTYFTWSDSRHSPQVSRRANSSSPDVPGSVWTTTPERIRRDLIATGIYRDTGIPLYDDRLAERTTGDWKMNAHVPIAHRVESEDRIRSPRHGLNGSQKVKYRDQAIMTEDPTKCLGPSLEFQETEESPAFRSQEVPHSPVSSIAPEVDRQKIARDARLDFPVEGSSAPNVQTPNPLGAKAVPIHQSPDLAGSEVNQEIRTQEMSDPLSVTSRDVMPPPPIPPGRNTQVVSPHANIREAEPLSSRQTVPLINPETERLQTHQIVSHNAAQNIQGSPENYDQITASSESTVNKACTLSSFDTASWIPQRTPSARTAETQSVISRPSMKSPFYVDQYERTLSGSSCRRDLTKSQEPESMAEFIARIENESQQQSYSYDDDNLSPGLSLEKAMQDLHAFDGEPSVQKPSADNERENTYPYLDPDSRLQCADLESSSIYHQGGGEYYLEAQHPHSGINVPRVFPVVTQPLEDFEEEHFEMSNFWRPNQFFQF